MYLNFIAAYAIVVGLLCVAAGLQEWWLWRSSQRRSGSDAPSLETTGNGERRTRR
jgi:hypothetical protein